RSPGSDDGSGSLATDRMPYGLHLPARGDLPGALSVGPAANHSLDVLRREALELRRLAVGAGEIERVHVHVPREPGGELALVAGEDVDHAAGEIRGGKRLGQLDRRERAGPR